MGGPLTCGFSYTIYSLIEIGASTVVLWELADERSVRQLRALRMIGIAFVALAIYQLFIQVH